MIQRFGHRFRADGRNRRQRHGNVVDRGDGIIEQLIGVEARDSLDLRNDFVGSSLHAEVVDVAAAQQTTERSADLAHGQAQLRRLVAIDFDHRLRRVDLQVGVDEHEHAAFYDRIEKGARHVIEPRCGFGGLDGELYRQAKCAGQGGLLKNGKPLSGQFIELLLQDILDLGRSELALVARNQRHTDDRLAGRIDLEYRHDAVH